MFGAHATVAAWIIHSKQYYSSTFCYSTNVLYTITHPKKNARSSPAALNALTKVKTFGAFFYICSPFLAITRIDCASLTEHNTIVKV